MPKRARWLIVGAVIIGIVTLLADFYFRSLVAAGANDGERAALIASDGALLWRRSVHLACSPGGIARIITKVRTGWREYARLGARSKGGFSLAAWQRRAWADVKVDTQMTITGAHWVDTLETDPIDPETLERIAAGLGKPDLNFVAVHGFEHGFYFERAKTVDLRPIERCLPRVRSA